MKSILSAFLIVFLIGCKSKQSVATAAANDNIEVTKIINGHYKNEHDFSTLNIRANAKYEDEKQSHSMNADIRIKKDEIIWINIKVLGFPVAKALITPTKVSYKEKINSIIKEKLFSFQIIILILFTLIFKIFSNNNILKFISFFMSNILFLEYK